MTADFVIVMVTCKDKVEAEKIAKTLLEEKLIACANIVGSVSSFFRWRGNADRCEECLVLMKSRVNLFDALAGRVRSLHSYEVPEVLAFPVVLGSADYLGWLEDSLK